ncbi:PREDICTED: elongation of very long chain fatty acids protein 7-like [Papilio polytes]|uniref:elongation of very long chain fatty acids protein 7-like n=1 Tax=Papilio polytes TaxID=76194 RepID=UPI0006761121|nr:PREDICTED: elongation of very long chain fatty acids protein 7-like [Papilio polytes]
MFNKTMFKGYLLPEKTSEDLTEKWLLMSSPIPVLAILITYLGFVLKIGPGFMRNRPPYNLKLFLVIYNIFQVVISISVFYKAVEHLLQYGLIIQNQCLTENKEFEIKTASIVHFYFLSKITELLDTIFFVLRKRDRQVSFLHVYHHTFAVFFGWCSARFEPAYIFIFIGVLNSFVHIIMYAYYGLSAFPNLTKYLWWKKYITKMQLVQFFLMILYLLLTPLMSSCRSSNLFILTLVINNLLFVYLFSNFYVKEYLKSRQSEKNINKSTPGVINSSDISHYKLMDKKFT